MREKKSPVQTCWSPKLVREMQAMFRHAHRDPAFRARFIADYRAQMAQGAWNDDASTSDGTEAV